MAGWDNFEHAKRWAIEHGFSCLVMFGDRPVRVFKTEDEAKANARMWRDHDRIPDVTIKRFRI